MFSKINKNNKISLLAVFVISFIILYFHYTLPRYKYYGFTKEFEWDILSYYLYLPLTFIKHDYGISDYAYIQTIFEQYHFSPSFYQANQLHNGNWVMVYTSGMAILQFPFFCIGHLWANLGGYPMDGFSFPYQFCVSTGNMFYIISGIFLMRKILLNYFSDGIVSVTLILLLLGTNYFREATDYNMGPHAILFALYCLLLLNTIKWHKTPKIKYSILVGISVGFLTLIRPTELICILIPIFWNVSSLQTLKNKISIVKQNWKHLLILVFTVLLVGLPQIIYWKYLTGSWVYNSYDNQISFDISESHLFKILFSFRKGWFVYSPLIVIALIGIYFLGRNKLMEARSSIVLFIICNVFILSHVPIWWNAGSFGQRFMVQSYALLALPMACFIEIIIFQKKIFYKILLIPIFIFLVFLNLFQTWQFVRWIIPGDGITKEFYFRSFLKTAVTEEDRSYLELQRTFDNTQKFDENNKAYKSKILAFYDIENFKKNNFVDSAGHALSGKKSFMMTSEYCYSPGVDTSFFAITAKDHAWIKFSVSLYSLRELEEKDAVIVMHFSHKEKLYSYMEFPFKQDQIAAKKWNIITAYYLTPSVFSEDDRLKAYVWYKGKDTLYVDNIKIEAFEKK